MRTDIGSRRFRGHCWCYQPSQRPRSTERPSTGTGTPMLAEVTKCVFGVFALQHPIARRNKAQCQQGRRGYQEQCSSPQSDGTTIPASSYRSCIALVPFATPKLTTDYRSLGRKLKHQCGESAPLRMRKTALEERVAGVIVNFSTNHSGHLTNFQVKAVANRQA